MKELTDHTLLNHYLQQYQIPSLFNTPNLPFHLYEYDAGELLDLSHSPEEYIKFLVEGEIRVYVVKKEGEMHSLYQGSHSALLSGWEFLGYSDSPYWTEAVTPVRCIELPLAPYRTLLLNDNNFLRYLLHDLLQKHMDYTAREISLATTVENRLLYYLQFEAPSHSFSGVEALAFRLHCSRSQIQKALRSMIQKGTLIKTGKGSYCLSAASASTAPSDTASAPLPASISPA